MQSAGYTFEMISGRVASNRMSRRKSETVELQRFETLLGNRNDADRAGQQRSHGHDTEAANLLSASQFRNHSFESESWDALYEAVSQMR
jgi:hypothetical protein